MNTENITSAACDIADAIDEGMITDRIPFAEFRKIEVVLTATEEPDTKNALSLLSMLDDLGCDIEPQGVRLCLVPVAFDQDGTPFRSLSDAVEEAAQRRHNSAIDEFLEKKYPNDPTNRGRARSRNTLMEFLTNNPKPNGEKETSVEENRQEEGADESVQSQQEEYSDGSVEGQQEEAPE